MRPLSAYPLRSPRAPAGLLERAAMGALIWAWPLLRGPCLLWHSAALALVLCGLTLGLGRGSGLARARRALGGAAGFRALLLGRLIARGWLVSVRNEARLHMAQRVAALLLLQRHGALHLVVPAEQDVAATFDRHAPDLAQLGVALGQVDGAMDDAQKRQAFAMCAVVAPLAQIAYAHLRDRLAFGDDLTALRLETQVLRRPGRGFAPVLCGLRAALVVAADQIMLDEAKTIFSVAGGAAPMFDQAQAQRALALAAALRPGADFTIRPSGFAVALTEAGQGRVQQYELRQGAVFDSEKDQETILPLALLAAHVLVRGQAYEIDAGQFRLMSPAGGGDGAQLSWGNGLQQMIEAKEGLALSPLRRSAAQLTVPGFLTRYQALAGAGRWFGPEMREMARTYGALWLRSGRRRLPPVRLMRDARRRAVWLGRRFAPEHAIYVSSARAEAAGLPAVWRLVPPEQAAAQPQENCAWLVLLDVPASWRQISRIAARTPKARVLLAPHLGDRALGGGARLWLLRRLWPVWPFAAHQGERVIWRHLRSVDRADARLRRAQQSAEETRRRSLAFAGKPL